MFLSDHHEVPAQKGPALFGLDCGEVTISESYWKASQIFKNNNYDIKPGKWPFLIVTLAQ